MRPRSNALDTSSNLLVHRQGQGVRLGKPDVNVSNQAGLHSISQIFQLPVNFYFLNSHSQYVNLNKRTASTCGYLSQSSAIGCSIKKVAKRDTADEIIRNDQLVMASRSLMIKEESYTKLDDCDNTAISLKFPWYHDNRVVGVFGCSILIEQNNISSLADSLALLVQTGLIEPSFRNPDSILSGTRIDQVYFDERETSILHLLVRGKTAKEIGKNLNLSNRTIEHRLEKIRLKTNTTSKSELIDFALDYFK